MEITYLGHSAFKLKGRKASLVTDPSDPKVTGLNFPKTVADIVTVSHTQHDDHKSVDLVGEYKKVISGPGEYEIMDISVIGIPSYHDDKKGELRGKNTIYVIEIDGVRLAHLGDLGHMLSEKILDTMGEIDVLFIPVGGFYTIGPDVAVNVAQAVEARITIPMHYQQSGLNKEVFGELVGIDEFVNKFGLPVTNEVKLSVKKETIKSEEKTVIFSMK